MAPSWTTRRARRFLRTRSGSLRKVVQAWATPLEL